MSRDDEIERELRAHLEMEIEEQQDHGRTPAQARQAALRAFGNPLLVKEQVRELSFRVWWERLAQDVRYGLRAMRRQPGFAAVVVLSLGLGIGANVAIFSILNALVLKTLPVREPARLATLDQGSWTNPIWEAIRDRQDALFDGAFAWGAQRFDLAERGESELVDGAYASGRMFEVLGVRPALGRFFTAADDVRGGGPDAAVAVIGYGLWQRRYGGRPDVIGQHATIERVPFTIIGVMPAGFFGPDVGRKADVFIPIAAEALVRGKESGLDNSWMWWLEIMVRMKPSQDAEQATAALRAVQPQIRTAVLPATGRPADLDDYLKEALTLLPAATGRSGLRTRYQAPLTIILVVAVLVLFIACANIANLVLARSNARRHELAVRLALGASRLRLARQLLTESALLAVAGAALGLIVAKWGAAVIVAQLGSSVSLDLSIDWRVFGYAAAGALGAVLLFGLAPALGVRRLAPSEALKEQGRSVTGDRRFGMRNALVVAQVGLSVVLVVGAALFLRTLVSLTAVPLGFDPDPLVVANLNLQKVPVEQRLAVYQDLREAAAAVPGVASATLSDISPLSGQGWNTVVTIPGGPVRPQRESMSWLNAVSTGWFATLGVPIIEGRDFTNADQHGSPAVAVVNRAFARKYFAGQDPVGRQFKTRDGSFEVIGLAADSVYRSPRQGAMPTAYLAMTQRDRLSPGAALTLRSKAGDPMRLTRSAADALGRVSSNVAFSFRAMATQTRATMAQERLVAILAGSFGVLALLLAAIGLYGVTSYSVNRRRAEIGIRMALGADAGGVMRLVLRRVGWLVGTGVALGALLSIWASHFIVSSLLFGVEARDPGTFALASFVLIVVGALAAWLPARRASRIDPTTVLRES